MYHKHILVHTKGDLLLKKKVVLLLCTIIVAGAAMYGCGIGYTNTSSADTDKQTSQIESQMSSDTASAGSGITINDRIKLTDTTYADDHINSVYPVVSHMDDATVEGKVNQLIDEGKQIGPKQYKDTANLDGTVEVTFLDGETLSLIYKWTLTNPDQNSGYPKVYMNSLVINLKTGEKEYLKEYASPYNMFIKIKYGQYQAVTDNSDAQQTMRLYMNSLLRNNTITVDRLLTADYPLSKAFPPNLYGYVTQDKIGLIVSTNIGGNGSLRFEFDRKDVKAH